MRGKKLLGGGGLIAASLVLFGTETLSWVWTKVLDFLFSRGTGLTFASLPWQNIVATLLAVAGLAVWLWPSKPKPPPPSRAAQLVGLVGKAEGIVWRIRSAREEQWFQRTTEGDILDLVRDGQSLLITFEKRGLPIPVFQTNSAERALIGMETYFAAIGPLIRDGHIDIVERSAKAIAERAEQASATFNLDNWNVRRL